MYNLTTEAELNFWNNMSINILQDANCTVELNDGKIVAVDCIGDKHD